jgi:excisionase family DNA binding protein
LELTLQQTATALGKTLRQVRYLIQEGRLPAHKVGGRWAVESADLEKALPGVAERAARRAGQLRAAIDEALTPGAPHRVYSIRDLKAVQIGTPLYRAVRDALGAGHPAAAHLKSALDHLGQGCHRFGRDEKAAAYRAARDAASLAAVELLLTPDGAGETWLAELEANLMPALAGLLRRMDRRRGEPG